MKKVLKATVITTVLLASTLLATSSFAGGWFGHGCYTYHQNGIVISQCAGYRHYYPGWRYRRAYWRRHNWRMRHRYWVRHRAPFSRGRIIVR